MSAPTVWLGGCSWSVWWVDDGWAMGQLRTLLLPDTLPWPLLVQQGLGEAGPAEVREGWERGAMKGVPMEVWAVQGESSQPLIHRVGTAQVHLAREENVPTRGHPRAVSSRGSCPPAGPSWLSFTYFSLLPHPHHHPHHHPSLGPRPSFLLPGPPLHLGCFMPATYSVVPWPRFCQFSLAHTCPSQLGHLDLVT